MKKTIPFTITTKIIKYLGIHLIKMLKPLYIENYKTLLRGRTVGGWRHETGAGDIHLYIIGI